MCGILGIVSSPKCFLGQKQILAVSKKLFILSESRGKEASGFAAMRNDEVVVYKTAFPANQMVKSEAYRSVFRQLFDPSNSVRAFIGHSRLVTDGYEHENRNNQPVIKKPMVVVHNGIITNKQPLWQKYNHIERESDLDSELIPVILDEQLKHGKTAADAFKQLYQEIYGMTSIALLHSGFDNLFLGTNNGSIYYLSDINSTCFIFASERYILKRLVMDLRLHDYFAKETITQLKPLTILSVLLSDFNLSLVDLKSGEGKFVNSKSIKARNIQEKETEAKKVFINTSLEHDEIKVPKEFYDEYHKRKQIIGHLRRCIKCILPETFPFITFDEQGLCNYCQNYIPIVFKGLQAFREHIKLFQCKKEQYDCLLPFSGGRDSSYAMHVIVKELNLRPLAFSYDWGMLTDLARRNQARMCGALGVEHILISADIRRKRQNIHKNVLAWLKRPSLGTVPLFMAGDKQYFYYANLLMKQNDLRLSILGENILETTQFKSGFCGIRPQFGNSHTYTLSLRNKLRMAYFYGKEYILNPAYLNFSLFDTFDAYRSYYVIDHNNVNLYAYLKWDEKQIQNTLINKYEWETDPGTSTTWRIGDGTAAFYNFIYYIIAGFTENDTFRSNQIREGDLSREEAMSLCDAENRPRWNSIKWYCDTIQINFDKTIRSINKIKTLYQ